MRFKAFSAAFLFGGLERGLGLASGAAASRAGDLAFSSTSAAMKRK
jgi:hypothetical protein